MNRNDLQDILDSKGLEYFKKACYSLSHHYEHSCILDSCQLDSGIYKGDYEFLAAFGAEKVVELWDAEKLRGLKGEWIFGLFSYDLKNQFEALSSNNQAYIDQEELALFVPKLVISIRKDGQLRIEKGTLDTLRLEETNSGVFVKDLTKVNSISKEPYVEKIKQIKELIRQGEVYELNYCVQHQYSFTEFDPLSFQLNLLERSPVPMASYFKWGKKHLCGASMERFIKKEGKRLISQPIKGTIKKGKTTEEDKEMMTALYRSEKDRAENVMIVDLVRNDLSRISQAGSVIVDELFGIYSYLQLHQMISTVSSVSDEEDLTEILKGIFPMGSMTGAPKISSMKHIEQLEDFKRGWYSGSIGYIKPNGDFDLNVVIRSLIADLNENKLAYSAGGAITIDSIPEGEWHECLLKTKAIESLLI